MKGDKKVIDFLNQILAGELTAINQYFLHSRMLKNWGYEELAHKAYEESIDEMKHAQKVIDRVLFLDGIPNLQKLNALRIGETFQEQLTGDLKLEIEAIDLLKQAIAACNAVHDHGTRELLEHILIDEEEHVDWIEAQQHIIKEVGIENYLAEKMGKST